MYLPPQGLTFLREGAVMPWHTKSMDSRKNESNSPGMLTLEWTQRKPVSYILSFQEDEDQWNVSMAVSMAVRMAANSPESLLASRRLNWLGPMAYAFLNIGSL